jgi:Uma2 family endonuclease
MDVAEYLRTSFDGPDCEYLDDEVVERNMGEIPHGDVQGNLTVWRDDSIGTGIPTVPPFLVFEVLSPEERMVRMLPKIQEYLLIGVE